MGYFRNFHSISGFYLYANEVSPMSKFLKDCTLTVLSHGNNAND